MTSVPLRQEESFILSCGSFLYSSALPYLSRLLTHLSLFVSAFCSFILLRVPVIPLPIPTIFIFRFHGFCLVTLPPVSRANFPATDKAVPESFFIFNIFYCFFIFISLILHFMLDRINRLSEQDLNLKGYILWTRGQNCSCPSFNEGKTHSDQK